MNGQPIHIIKTAGNGMVVSYEPTKYAESAGKFFLDGKFCLYTRGLPTKHSSGAMIVGLLTTTVGKETIKIALTESDLARALALNATYVPTMIDRMAALDEAQRSAAAAALEIGSAWTSSIETARRTGRRPDATAQEARETADAAAAAAQFEAAKAADPQAWAVLVADRSAARARAGNN